MSAVPNTQAQPPSLRATGRSRRRLIVNYIAMGAAVASALVAVGMLVVLVGSVLVRGLPALNLDFFIKGQAVFGETGGGIAPAIVGTIMLVLIASAIAIPIGVLVAIFVSEFAPPRVGEQMKLWLDVLNGFPSIVIGIFVFELVVAAALPTARDRPPPERVGRRFRALDHHAAARRPNDDGGARSRSESPPRSELRARRLEVANRLSIVIPAALGGIVTGTTLAVARAAGETAPLLFTCSIFGQVVSTNPSHPVASIPVIIFEYSESPDKNLNAQAWAAAFVLITFVLVTSRRLATDPRPVAAQARTGAVAAPSRLRVHHSVTSPSPPFSTSRAAHKAQIENGTLRNQPRNKESVHEERRD